MGRKAKRKAAAEQKGFFLRGGISPLEHLETRRLLSQVNVTSFGATPNDGSDDTVAIRNAMNASAAGDTIYFPAGTFNVNDTIFLKGSRSYTGADGAIIRGSMTKYLFRIQQDNTTVENLSLFGIPIMIDRGDGQMVSNVVINDNTLDSNGSDAESDNTLTFTTGLRNSKITNNQFNIGNGHIGIYGYYWDGLTIANNNLVNGGRGIHVHDFNDTSKNLLIEQNYIAGISRMGVEMLGGGWNSIIQDNWYEKPVMTPVFADNWDTFAFSIVADFSHNTIARRNVIWAPERPDGVGVRIGFETGGDGTLVENNYVYGLNQVLANTDGNGTTSCVARNNHYHQVLDGLVGRGLTQTNNGPQVDQQWLIDRGRPAPNRRFGSTSTPASPPASPPPASPPPPPASAPIALPAGTVALSSLNWTSATNGWGAVEKDRSNGEIGATDGKTITLNGQGYTRGLGVHANSEIVYNLNKQYTKFASDIGIDDEVGNSGSSTFQVWVDGVKAYESAKLTGGSAVQSVNIDVTGKTTLKLVVTNGADTSDYDHADWANARLTPASGTPVNSPSVGTWLSDLNWTSASNAWGAVEKDRSNGEMGANDGKGLAIRSETFTKGLGVHANSDIHYNINGQYDTFVSDIGIDNETGGRGSVIFRIYLDGTLLYDSGVMRGTDAAKEVSVDVTGGKDLRLVVTDAGDGNTFDHADWAGAKLLP